MGDPLRVLITGGAGFVGTATVKAFAKKHPEWKLIVTDIKPKEQWDCPEEGVEYIQADLRKPFEASNAVEWATPQVIVHASGIVPGGKARYARRPQDEYNVQKTNVTGTENILAAAEECGVKSFVYTSSCTVITDDLDHDYPNMHEDIPIPPRSLIYGESKAKAESLVLDANGTEMVTCALRPSVIFGPGDYQLVPSIHACIAKGEGPFLIGDGNNLYDFTFVDNIAYAHVLAVENLLGSKSAAGQAIFISNDQPVTFRAFCLAIWSLFGYTPRYSIRIPSHVAWGMGALAEFVSWISGTPITLSRGSVKDAIGTRYASQDKAKQLLRYKPEVDLWDGLRLTCEAYQSILSEKQKLFIPVRGKD